MRGHAASDDPILKRSRAALDEMYREPLQRVVLFGSRARGDAGEGSDYDLAEFLNDLKEGDLADRWCELDRLADLRSEILSDTEAFIDAKPYPVGAYRNPTALMAEIRREGARRLRTAERHNM
jgi:predicted nucleotidyltransferase